MRRSSRPTRRLAGPGVFSGGAASCKGTTAFLEKYVEDGQVKHFNYVGPGNPLCEDYIRDNPPVTHINGERTHSDEIAKEHDLEYEAADSLPEPERPKAIRAADDKFFAEHAKYPNEPGKQGLYVMKAKRALEDRSKIFSSLLGKRSGRGILAEDAVDKIRRGDLPMDYDRGALDILEELDTMYPVLSEEHTPRWINNVQSAVGMVFDRETPIPKKLRQKALAQLEYLLQFAHINGAGTDVALDEAKTALFSTRREWGDVYGSPSRRMAIREQAGLNPMSDRTPSVSSLVRNIDLGQ